MLYVTDTENRGKGLFTDEEIKKGDPLFATFEPYFKAINHSCDPNCEIVKPLTLYWVCPIRDLLSDDELTIDYEQVPFPCAPLEFDCQCGVPTCRRHIKL